MFWGLVFLLQDSELGGPMWGSKPSFEKTSAIGITLLFVGCLARDVDLDYTSSLPLLPVSLWFLPYVLGCRSFLVSSGLFIEVVLQIVVILVFSLVKMSSGSFYSTMITLCCAVVEL